MQEISNRSEKVIALATRIISILEAHPNPHEAHTACEIAGSLTTMRVKFSSFWQTSTESELEQSEAHPPTCSQPMDHQPEATASILER